jgi:hypothetical protein
VVIPRIIVSPIRSFAPAIDPFIRIMPIRLDVAFLDGSSAWLDPAMPVWRRWAFGLSQLQRYGLLVYIEADPDTGVILDYEVPVTGRVVRLDRVPGGSYRIVIEGNFRVFMLSASNPHFKRFLEILERAREDGSAVVLTNRDDPNQIVDIRIPPPPPFATTVIEETPLCSQDAGEMPIVTEACRDAMFALVSGAENCIPAAETPGCIPFLYPNSGCEARAHRMCQLISGQGVIPAKVFNYPAPGDILTVSTPNASQCVVYWAGHIAPVLQVDTGQGTTAIYVIDPSLFPSAVTLTEWLARQAGSYAHYLVSWQCYEPTVVPLGPWNTDPGSIAAPKSQTNVTLGECRGLLGRLHPPPPYSYCPGSQTPGTPFKSA